MGNGPSKTNLAYRQSRRGWLKYTEHLNLLDDLDASVINLIIKRLDQKSILNLFLVCKHFRIQAENSAIWNNTIPSNMKFLCCQPTVQYSELMESNLSDKLACKIMQFFYNDGFIVVKLGATGRQLIQDLHKTVSEFWNGGVPAKWNLESSDQYGSEPFRSYFHISKSHKNFPWHGATEKQSKVITEFEQFAFDITQKLLLIVCNQMGFPAESTEKDSFLRVTEYPPSPELSPQFHSDLGLFALVPCSNLGTGLEFQFLDDTPKTIEIETLIEADEVVVFPGATLDFASSGRIKTVFHRVKNHPTTKRQNAVFQLRADPSYLLESNKGSMTIFELFAGILRKQEQLEKTALNQHLKTKYNEGKFSKLENMVVESSIARRVVPLVSTHYERLVDAIPPPVVYTTHIMDEPLYQAMQYGPNPLYQPNNPRSDEPLFRA